MLTYLALHLSSNHLRVMIPIAQAWPCDLSYWGCGSLEKPGADPQAAPQLEWLCTGREDEKWGGPVGFCNRKESELLSSFYGC